MSRPGSRPWPGETVATPQRLEGQRVVCAYKRTTTVSPAHVFDVVIEEAGGNTGTFAVAVATFVPGRWNVTVWFSGLDYDDAVAQWKKRIPD